MRTEINIAITWENKENKELPIAKEHIELLQTEAIKTVSDLVISGYEQNIDMRQFSISMTTNYGGIDYKGWVSTTIQI